MYNECNKCIISEKYYMNIIQIKDKYKQMHNVKRKHDKKKINKFK